MGLPFVLAVLVACGASPAPGSPAPPAAPATAAVVARRVDVTIARGMYDPEQVAAQPGERLVLVFHNDDDNPCGATVRLPATGEQHEVPKGASLEVPVTAPASGKLDFVCSMEHCHVGAVVVGG